VAIPTPGYTTKIWNLTKEKIIIKQQRTGMLGWNFSYMSPDYTKRPNQQKVTRIRKEFNDINLSVPELGFFF